MSEAAVAGGSATKGCSPSVTQNSRICILRMTRLVPQLCYSIIRLSFILNLGDPWMLLGRVEVESKEVVPS